MGQIRHPNSTHRTKQQRRESAMKLDAERNERTTEQQLKLLDKRLGKGKGAKKERARLNLLLERAKNV